MKLSAGQVGQKVKSGLHDLNVKINPKNYAYEPGLAMPGVGSTGGNIARVADEPLFRFSSGGGESVGNTITKVKYGDHFTKKGRKKVLKPNVEYISPDGYNYSTDSQGCIIECEGALVLGKGDRSEYAQRTVGKGQGRLPDDDGGHLIGGTV